MNKRLLSYLFISIVLSSCSVEKLEENVQKAQEKVVSGKVAMANSQIALISAALENYYKFNEFFCCCQFNNDLNFDQSDDVIQALTETPQQNII